MNTTSPLHHSTSELVADARAVHEGAGLPDSYAGVPDSLASMSEALQVLSAAWYQLAAHASPGIAERRRAWGAEAPLWPAVAGLSREQEVHLMATLHDVAEAFSRCARICREGRSTVSPLIARRIAAGQAEEQRRDDERSLFESRSRPTERVA